MFVAGELIAVDPAILLGNVDAVVVQSACPFPFDYILVGICKVLDIYIYIYIYLHRLQEV